MNFIAKVLRENIDLVETVFSPLLTKIDLGRYAIPTQNQVKFIRYCESCARLGYHSYLHELYWLAKCPFHLCELQTKTIGLGSSIFMSSLDTLQSLMCEFCTSWPYKSNEEFSPSGSNNLEMLEKWMLSVSKAALEISDGEIWSSDSGENSMMSIYQVFSQLRTLVNIPKEIESIFTNAGEKWTIKKKIFPNAVKEELHRVSKYSSFGEIFFLYKKFQPLSPRMSKYILHLKKAQEIIENKHGVCQCSLILIKAGWSYRWIEISPGDRPYYGLFCPYEKIINDLELDWGRYDVALSRQRAFNLECYLHASAAIIKDAEIFNKVSTTHYIWNEESVLTELFNAMAGCEIDEYFRNSKAWLTLIDDGKLTARTEDHIHCVRLLESEDGLVLIYWNSG
ncbi:hypothetical protein [Comamonas testosteroni]|nr:hypothetical protein [Comamonas testosteroni]